MDLATLLLQLPKPAQGSALSMSVAEAMEAGFLPELDEDQADMFTQFRGVVLVPTRSGPQVTYPGYSRLSQFIL